MSIELPSIHSYPSLKCEEAMERDYVQERKRRATSRFPYPIIIPPITRDEETPVAPKNSPPKEWYWPKV